MLNIHFLSIDSSVTPDPYANLISLFPMTIGEITARPYKTVIGKAADGPSFEGFSTITDDRSILASAAIKPDQSGFEIHISKLTGGRYVKVQTISQEPGGGGNFGSRLEFVANDTMLLIGQGSSWIDNQPASVFLYKKNAQGLFDLYARLNGTTNESGTDITGLDNFAFNADASVIAANFNITDNLDQLSKITVWRRTGAVWSAGVSNTLETTRVSGLVLTNMTMAISGDGLRLFFRSETSPETSRNIHCFNVGADNVLTETESIVFPYTGMMSMSLESNPDGSDVVAAYHPNTPADASHIYFLHYHIDGTITENQVTVPGVNAQSMLGYVLKLSKDGETILAPGSVPVTNGEDTVQQGAVHQFKKVGGVYVLTNTFFEPNVGTGLMGEYFTEVFSISAQGSTALLGNPSWTTPSDETLGVVFVVEL